MASNLFIIPTKDRCEYINCLIQNLITQEGDFDVFIADMSSNPDYLSSNWLFRNGLERLRMAGHQYIVRRVEGVNQLAGYNAGLDYAIEHKYEFCGGGDDDLIYEPGWFTQGIQRMKEDINLGICCGITLVPVYSKEEQTIGIGPGLPYEVETYDDFSGTIEKGNWVHCVFIPPRKTPKYYERVYGAFLFRTEDGRKVGGFPKYLGPLGFGGEGIFETAIFWLGKKMMVDPTMISWHYQANYGGLRFDPQTKERLLKEDAEKGKIFMERRLPWVPI